MLHTVDTDSLAGTASVLCISIDGRHSLCVDCRDAQLSSVLDNGAGTPAALAVLYMEVARRLGLPMVSLS